MSLERLMIASTIEPIKQGEFKKLPPHLVVIPGFALDKQRWPELDEYLQDIRAKYPSGPFPRPFIAERVKYGVDNDISARLAIINATGGSLLYTGLYGMIRQLGSELDMSSAGMSWAPRVTDTSLQEGQSLRFDNLTVFQRQSDHISQVKALYRWGAHVDETAS